MKVLSSIKAIPPRRLARLIALPVLVLTPFWAGTRLLVALNADAPVREAISLKSALEGARRARARDYAATDLKIAEAAADQALSEYYRTVSEKTGFLRYDLIRRHLQRAREKADWAWTRARQRGDAARDYARNLIAEGRAGVQAADEMLESTPIGAAVRGNLARARIAVAYAATRWAQGDYDVAAREAGLARSITEEIRGRGRSFIETYTTGQAAQKWARDVRATVEASRRSGDYAIVVDKLHHKCHLYRGGNLVRSYDVDLGAPVGDKLRAGDRATPEGTYKIMQKRGPGQTTYYKALLINYPNDEDRARFALAQQKGWISRRSRIGGLIEIHGEGGRREDWTLGCVALANRDMDDLFGHVQVGTPVTIVGTIGR